MERAAKVQVLEVFVSSPGDVEAERQRVGRVVARLNGEFREVVRLKLIRWEERFYTADRSFQEQIAEAAATDFVVCILWSRIGSLLPPEARRRSDSSTYESGTVYEVETALASKRQTGTPDIYVFRKTAEVRFSSDDAKLELERTQFRLLETFWQKWFKSPEGHFTAAFQTFATTDAFEEQLEACLRQWLEANGHVASGPVWDIRIDGSPFRGLEPFEAHHERVFFGRRLVVERCRERLVEAAAGGTAFLLVLGASGSGKSSLVRAGLVPRLTLPGVVEGVDLWRRCIIRPGAHPFAALGEALFEEEALPELAEGDFPSASALAEPLHAHPPSIVRLLGRALERAAESQRQKEGYDRPVITRLLLVLDQFEELFLAPPEVQAAGRDLPSEMITFIDQSVAADKRARTRKVRRLYAVVASLAILFAAAVVGAWYASMQEQEAVRQRDRATAELDRRLEADTHRLALAARSQTDEGRPEVGIQLAFMALASHAEASAPPPSRWRAIDALAWSISAAPLPLADLRHKGFIFNAVFSPDAQQVITASDDHTARLWDAGSGHELFVLQHESPVVGAAFSPDGQKLLTGSGPARVWDTATGAQLAMLPRPEGESFNIAFSPDGEKVLSRSEMGDVRLRDAGDGRELVVFRHGRSVYLAAFSPDGEKVVTSSEDGRTRVWNAASGAEIADLRTHKPSFGLVFSPDGRRILTASEDGTARLWDVGDRSELLVLRHQREVGSAVFSPDGRRILTASVDGTARLWDAATGAELLVLRHGAIVLSEKRPDVAVAAGILPGPHEAIFSAVFSPDGRTILTAATDRTARLWDATTGAELAVLRHEQMIASATFSPDGRKVLTRSLSVEDGVARLWDVSNGREFLTLRHEQEVGSIDLSPDGRKLITPLEDGTALLCDTTSGAELAVLRGHEGPVRTARFSTDGKRILTASEDRTARLWDAATGAELAVLRGHEGPVRTAIFNPEGQKLVTAAEDGTARLWDAATGAELAVLRHESELFGAFFSSDGRKVVTLSWDRIIHDMEQASKTMRQVEVTLAHVVRLWDASNGRELLVLRHEGAISFAFLSPDGQKLVTPLEDGTSRLWDAATGAELAVLRGHEGPVTAARFSSDGRKVLTFAEDSTARLWDAATGAELAVLRGHEGPVRTARFSTDGKRILTASEDRTARLWDAATGAELAVLRGHEDAVRFAAFSPDERTVVTESKDRSVRLWHLPAYRMTDELVAYAKALALPALSEEQCRYFGIPAERCTWPPH